MEKTAPKAKQEELDYNELRDQIDTLEDKIRSAELQNELRMEEAAPLRTIYKWKAPERVYDPKAKPWYVTIAFVVVLVVAYAALTANFFLIVSMIALLILVYALNVFPPNIIEHEITNKGIRTFNKIYLWRNIAGFWLTQRGKHLLIHIELRNERITRMILLVGEADPERIVAELVKRIDYINPSFTRVNILTELTEGKHLPITKYFDVFEKSKGLEGSEEKPKPRKSIRRSNSV